MSCKICGRSSCIQSFHSLEQQALFEQREAMPDDVHLLRRMVQEASAELVELKVELESKNTRLDEYSDAMSWLDRNLTEKEAERMFGNNFPRDGEVMRAALCKVNGTVFTRE